MKKNFLAIGIIGGVALGTLLGLVFKNLSLFLAFCSAGGWMFGLFMDQKTNNN